MFIEQFLLKVNIFSSFWLTVTTFIFILGLIILYFPNLVPSGLINIYLFGKLCSEKDELITKTNFVERLISILNISVSKSYFCHFYIFAVVNVSIILFTRFFAPSNAIESIRLIIDFLFGRRNGTATAINSSVSILVALLSMCHFYRRLYESIFVNVSVQKMNIFHYFMGLIFYASFNLQLLNLLLPTNGVIEGELSLWSVMFGVVLFVFGSYFQSQSLWILRNLRTSKNGEVLEKLLRRHEIPVGGLFSYISCPHYFCEIVIYISLFVVSNYHISWTPLIYWVISCHIVNGLFTHRWYKKQFKSYPTQRKAIFPFIL